MVPFTTSGRSGRLGLAALAGAAALLTAGGVASAQGGAHTDHGRGRHDNVRHVLLLSVDGLHQSDLDWYVKTHPASALSSLVGHGVQFTNAETPVPSA
jgi:hypothetical protein